MEDPQDAELQARLAALERSLADLTAAGVGEAALAVLEQQAAAIRQQLSGTGLQVGHDQTVQGDVVQRDKIDRQVNPNGPYIEGDVTVIGAQAAERFLGSLRPQLSKDTLRLVTAAYFQALLDRHLYLNMKGMGVADRVPLRLPLLDVYVPLKARLELPEGETWRRGLKLAGRGLSAPEEGASELRLSEPMSVLDVLQKHDGLIILGDPGAGKTTFLKFLALRLALGQGADLGLGERLPVLVPLSAYANALSARDVPLDEFIAQYFHDLGTDLPLGPMLTAALDAGAALVLLDGLDEVKDLALRHTVVERVADFYAFRRRKGNKFVLTSRVVGYRAVRPTADGLAECTLVDFDDNEIAAFVEQWTGALERQAQGDTATAAADAARERRELLDAIQRNPSVRRLAANPLLLTILAMMKRQGVTLPERRVELYDQYVTTLLSTWNRARGLGRPPTHDLDVVQTMRMLAPLALWMHEASPGVGLVKREDLRRKLTAICAASGEPHPDQAARQFLDDVREHAGLLLERGPEEYGFIHLTFEEYLAAVAIALDGQGDCRPIMDRIAAHVGDPAWREVALLTVGYLGIRQQLPRVAGGVVEALADEQPGAPGEAVVLAGDAVLDAWPGGVLPGSKAAVIEALVPTMQAAAVPLSLRRRAGLLLGRLGWLPPDLDEFVAVPAGEFLYGDPSKKRQIPAPYWIGKYPVTNAQYARFVADKGYERPELWGANGWRWRIGSYDITVTDSWMKDWLARRPPELRHQPFWWDDLELANPIFPVVGVTWFEAEAYANWLNTRSAELQVGAAMPKGYRVRLATEEEWERAARGTDGREYPWRGDFDFANANVAEEIGKGIGATAVCSYPQGISPVGAWDMIGNVWEWTHSLWSAKEPDRVLRGGSWHSNQRLARCAYRHRRGPDYFDDVIGFRVVVSLSNSGF
jgi:formylglycine-generating enzyme required for sulfatase activity